MAISRTRKIFTVLLLFAIFLLTILMADTWRSGHVSFMRTTFNHGLDMVIDATIGNRNVILRNHSNTAKTTYYVTPEEASNFKPANDHRLAANVSTSKVLMTQMQGYSLGDTVTVKVVLYDGYGNRKQTGGDSIRARMFEESRGAYATGHVTDYHNGTYMITFMAYWAGSPRIAAYLDYTRESIRVMYQAREPAVASKGLIGVFRSNNIKEETTCYPSETGLQNYNTSGLCDLTAMNSGMPFYCVKPKNRQLSCGNWEVVRDVGPNIARRTTFSSAEQYLNMRRENQIGHLNINVSKDHTDKDSPDETLLSRCSDYDCQQLWEQNNPTGYFYKDQWHLSFCKLLVPPKYEDCLKMRELLIFGDSTTRQWYTELRKHITKCDQITEKWTNPTWHKASTCVDTFNSITIKWLPHAHAFYNDAGLSTKVPNIKTISTYIDEIDNSTDVIVVIHMFLHSLQFHHDVFRRRMAIIRQSAEKLLQRNPTAVVAIKGPHAYAYTYGLEDYYGYLYREIMLEEFKGLHGRVVYLDYIDMTTAKYSMDAHPSGAVVREMVRLLLGFICH